MSETIKKLQDHLTAVMPLLATNLSGAYTEWMNAQIPRGVYEYCLSRQSMALAILGAPAADLSEEKSLQACTHLFTDLSSVLRDLKDDEKTVAQATIDSFKAFYVEQGFTAVRGPYDAPARPNLAVG